MTATSSPTSPSAAGTVLHGVPVVAGVQYAPVIRPGAPPDLSADTTAELAEGERADEVQRFTDAAATVAAAGGTVSLVMHTPGLLSAPGLRPERRLEDVRAEALRHSFSVNAFGPILAARAFVPLLQHGEAAVFASLSARVGSIGDNRLGGWYAYRAAKAAQNQLIHTLAIEAARRSPALICCTLHPGTVDTGLSRPFQGNVPAARLFSPARAAGQLLDVVDRLTPEDRGACLAWDGQRIPW